MTDNLLTNLPLELQYQIYLRLPAEELVNLCLANRDLSGICKDPDFWRFRAFQDFRVTTDIFDDTNLPPDRRYLQLLSTIGKNCVPGSERYTSVKDCIRYTAMKDNRVYLDYFLSKSHDINDLGEALIGASSADNIETVKYVIELSRMKDKFIDQRYLTIALNSAVKNGNLNLVKYLFRIVDTYYPQIHDFLAETLSFVAARYNNIDMLLYLRSIGASDMNNILFGAIAGDHPRLINFAINAGGTDFNHALVYAVNTGNMNMIDYVIGLGVTNFIPALERTIIARKPEILRYLLDHEDLILQPEDLALLRDTSAFYGDNVASDILNTYR